MLKKKPSLKNSFNLESSKINNNESQFRNNSTNHFYLKDLYNQVLPRINSEKNNFNRKLNDSNNKSSYASTFYSTTGNNQRLLTEGNQNIKNNNVLKYILSREKLHFKKKKKLEINPSYFDSNPSKKKTKEIDLYIQEDYDSMGTNKDYDYSNLIKKLDRWDEDNCLFNKNDKATLYNILYKFYKKKNMKEELKNINTLESLLKSKTDYDKLLRDHLEYKSSKLNTESLSPEKKYALSHFNKSNNSRNNNSNNKKKINNPKFEIDDVKLLSEKIKYETQLHNDLIFVNTLLYNKKILKEEKLKKLEELYKTRAELRQTYDKSYNHNMKDYWNRYDQYEQRYKKLEKLMENQNMKENGKSNKNLQNSKEPSIEKEKQTKEEEQEQKEEKEENKENNEEKKEEDVQENVENSIGSKNEDKSSKQINKVIYASPPPKKGRKKLESKTEVKRSYNRRFSASQIKFIKEMNFIKATKINTINFEMKRKIEKLKNEYQEKIKDIDDMQVVLEEEIQIIKNEISYYKQVNEELVREYRNYYLKILKKGNDHRKEGLVWVVKNLLELQINLEYQHFPKYLTHEHIDYLIELAHLLLEQSELIIIIKVLRKKQTTTYIDENIQTYNMLDKYMEEHLKERKNRNSLMGDIMSSNLYSKHMQLIIREIDKKFENVYKNNKEIVKNYLEKNEEEVKLRNALEHIKKGLYNSDKFVKENQGSILDAFIGNSKNKDFFSFILKIRNRLNQLEVIISNLIKKEKDYYIEQIQKYNSATKNFDINFYKDVIKKSLFGEKFEVYE